MSRHIILYNVSTKTLDIGRIFSYFLNVLDESRRLSSYLFKVSIDRTVVQPEDGRTDGRNTFSSLKSNDETRRHRKISVVCSADVELRTDDCQPWFSLRVSIIAQACCGFFSNSDIGYQRHDALYSTCERPPSRNCFRVSL